MSQSGASAEAWGAPNSDRRMIRKLVFSPCHHWKPRHAKLGVLSVLAMPLLYTNYLSIFRRRLHPTQANNHLVAFSLVTNLTALFLPGQKGKGRSRETGRKGFVRVKRQELSSLLGALRVWKPSSALIEMLTDFEE
ncbi:Hypothetical protein NTJ_05319 [Nesidiocoris tenuis]|uniref:Uncharacterized protein n=1 Tax=Nesidiocoris tenuis TaxID=355587 RepID=A0ABN7AJS9_9HEMI|nr:Hypothetical protein NTJ_05319 [Nesidiocoris tenuis]